MSTKTSKKTTKKITKTPVKTVVQSKEIEENISESDNEEKKVPMKSSKKTGDIIVRLQNVKPSDKLSSDQLLVFTDDASTQIDFSSLTKAQLINELNKKEKMLTQMKKNSSKVQPHKSLYDLPKPSEHILLDMQLFDISDNDSIISGTKLKKKTNILCWWCCHSFNTVPCFIPEKYHEQIFYVFGCFCSFNCALAYNLNMTNDYRIVARTTLINNICNKIYGKHISLEPAPRKEILESFGGKISIENYRKSFNNIETSYYLQIPPSIPLIPEIQLKQKQKFMIEKGYL